MERAIEFNEGSDQLRVVETEVLIEGDVYEIGARIEVGTGADQQSFAFTLAEFEEFIDEMKKFHQYLADKLVAQETETEE